jgi:AP-1-like factor
VVDANGNIVKPSDLWVKMGMQHQDNVDNLVIDDLCDQMRAKAKCHDGESFQLVTLVHGR